MPDWIHWLIVIILIMTCSGCKQRTPGGEGAPESSEEILVIQAVINEYYLTGTPPGLLVIMKQTATDFDHFESSRQVVNYIKKELGQAIDDATLRDLLDQNKQPRSLEGQLTLSVPVVYIDKAELDSIFAQEDGWRVFYDKYPNSPGVITISRVGFNSVMNQAIVYLGNQADYLAGAGYYIFLIKEGGSWQVQERVRTWVS